MSISFVKASMLDAFKDVQIQSFKSNTECTDVASAQSSESVSLVDALIEKFSQSFAKGDKPDEALDKESKYIVNLVDKDKNGVVSLDELKSFDDSNISSDLKTKIDDLKDNFKLYDKDQSGGLSLAETKNALGKKQYSIQELSAMANEDKTENQNKVAFDVPSYACFQNALDAYNKIDSALQD